MSTYLVIRKMQIHNANAMSSTYTIGVPAMTAWLGAVHALERKVRGLNQKREKILIFQRSISQVSQSAFIKQGCMCLKERMGMLLLIRRIH